MHTAFNVSMMNGEMGIDPRSNHNLPAVDLDARDRVEQTHWISGSLQKTAVWTPETGWSQHTGYLAAYKRRGGLLDIQGVGSTLSRASKLTAGKSWFERGSMSISPFFMPMWLAVCTSLVWPP